MDQLEAQWSNYIYLYIRTLFYVYHNESEHLGEQII